MLLSIAIPTYNRCQFLKKNCNLLINYILKNKLQDDVQLIISNNQSSDNTKQVLQTLTNSTDVKLITYNQPINIGPVNNVLFLLEKTVTDFIMFLGDDDFIEEQYLLDVLTEIKYNNIFTIIPSNKGVSVKGVETGFSRDILLNNKKYPAGFYNCLENSWRGHQMSGLVFKRDGLFHACKENDIKNMYLFIFLVAFNTLRGNLLHLTTHPVIVSSPTQGSKGWSYGKDGLISDIFDNYKKLHTLTLFQRFRLEFKILDMQYWRYAMYIKLGITNFISAILNITFGKNTSFLTQILFPVLLPFILIKQAIILFLNGKLLKTISRTVDI